MPWCSSSCRIGAATILAMVLSGSLLRSDQEAPEAKAFLVVKLPAAATLTIDGEPTQQKGQVRRFETPPLPGEKQFYYTLVATWIRGNVEHSETRKAMVQADMKTLIDFNTPDPAAVTSKRRTRSFLFTYSAVVTGVEPGQTIRAWLPVPPSNEDQEIQIASKDLPAGSKLGQESKYGNHMLYVEAAAGKDGRLPMSVTYRVMRREVKGGSKLLKEEREQLSLFLQPDALVPVDGKPLELIKDKPVPMDHMAAARMLYDVVNSHMRYSKQGAGWGRGDSAWACENGYGNCTDFHSLFISLARANQIPAKFEIGFPLPARRGAGDIPGYHCWAKFLPQSGEWVPVDISEANKEPEMRDYYFGNLTEDRVTFSTGRDLDLTPRQKGKPINFLVYPYVEVGDKVHPADQISRKFGFQDLE